MSANMHHTFRNLAAEKTYAIDNVIAELERLRECQLSAVQGRLRRMQEVMETGQPIGYALDGYQPSPEESFVMYNNALVIAKALKDKRIKTVVLNEAKNFPDQILALASQELVGLERFSILEWAAKDQQRLFGNKGRLSSRPS